MSWIYGEMILEGNSKKDLQRAYGDIRSMVRHSADLEEFPHMGEDLFQIIEKGLICNSLEKAREEADQYDWERNYNILIPFKDVDSLKKSKKLQSLEERLNKEKKKLEDYKDKTDCKTSKSKLITCPNCESKINKKYIRNSRCPLCNQDLRSKTTIETIKRYEENIKKLKKEIQLEKEKASDKAKTKYLLMYEEYVG